jgi:two-component system sensor histidine kinase TctE
MGGTITLRCGTCSANTPDTESSVQYGFLEVEDDGPGIAPSERERSLERFDRVPGTTGEGNGLGLAIADEIARLHGTQLELSDGQAKPGTPPHTRPRGLVVRVRLAQYQPSA